MIFRQLFDAESSTYTYLIGCPQSRQAALIDPVKSQLPAYVQLLADLNLSLVAVLDTHTHADHITAARKLRELCLHFAAAQTALQPRVFWKICAAFFESQVLGLNPDDLHAKRVTSRILQQYSALVRGELGVSDRLVLDLLFFAAQARLEEGVNAPILRAVRAAFGVQNWTPVDYESSPFGRFDPALLAQARKRIGSVKEALEAVPLTSDVPCGHSESDEKEVRARRADLCERLERAVCRLSQLELEPETI